MSFKRASGYLPSRSSAARSSSARWKSRRDWSERISHGLALMSLPIADRTVSTGCRLVFVTRTRKNYAVLGRTPNGFDWVYDKFIGARAKLRYTAILANPGENTHLPGDFTTGWSNRTDERASRSRKCTGSISRSLPEARITPLLGS